MMRKIIKITAGCLSALLMAACNSNDEPKLETTFTEFGFKTGNLTIDLTKENEPIRLEWEESQAENGTLVFYRVLFSNKKDGFSDPSYELTPNRMGMDNYIVLTDSMLNIAAEMAGVRQSESGTFYWSILASNGVSSHQVKEGFREITVTRPDGFAAIPEKLYVKLGDEYVRMKGTQFRGTDTIPVGFDVLVELEESERISITDSKLGRQRYFSLTSDFQVQEVYEGDVEMTVPVSGVYHVGMDFVTKEAFFSKVEQVDLIVLQNGKPDDVVTTLEYEGNYVWGSQYTALLSDGSALPNGAAYKFRMTESSGKVTYWGSSSKMVNPPTEDTASSYFYVTKVSEGMSNFYRFPILVSGKQMNVMLSMAPSEENWYHTNN